mgnify:CR=1 FL=1
MNTQENTRTYKSGELMKRFLPYYKKYWKIVVIDLLCAGLTTICELVGQWCENSVTSKRSLVMRPIICPTLVLL